MKKGEKRRLVLKISTGFMVLYLAMMCIFTMIIEHEYENKFENDLHTSVDNVSTMLYEVQSRLWYWERMDIYQSPDEYLDEYFLYYDIKEPESEFNQMSYFIYDKNKNLKDQTKIQYSYYDDTLEVQENIFFDLDKFLTNEELKRVMQYISKNYTNNTSETYRVLIGTVEEQKEMIPAKLYIERVIWHEADGTYHSQIDPLTNQMHAMSNPSMVQIDSEIVWEWHNQDIKEDTKKLWEVSFTIPYMEKGYKNWEKWYDDSYLQQADYINTEAQDYEFGLQKQGIWKRKMNYTSLASYRDDIFQIQINATTYPYLAAINHLKYIYIFAFVACTVCVVLISVQVITMYDKRIALEQNRKDFTNAMAHELKTPLSIIRSFSENISENIRMDKNQYYAKTIINQVDHMDDIIVQMLELSKMNADDFHLIMESQNINKILQGLLKEYEPFIKEKQIHIIVTSNENINIIVDKKYFSIAIRNLISNAVSYTPLNGIIEIQLSKYQFRIDNTVHASKKLVELNKIWDMFYRLDEEENQKEKHFGMGLYVVKRIAELHHMKCSVEYTKNGIGFTIKW